METIIGRDAEISQLKALVESPRSEFVALYGRRRVQTQPPVTVGRNLRLHPGRQQKTISPSSSKGRQADGL